MKLHELSQEMTTFLKTLETLPEDVDPSEKFEALQASFDDKMNNSLKYYFNLDNDINTIDSEIKRLTALKKSTATAAKRIEWYINYCMALSWQRNYMSTIGKVSYRKSTSVIIVDDSIIPKEYYIQKPAPAPQLDKKAVWDALKAETPVPWTRLDTKDNIQIK